MNPDNEALTPLLNEATELLKALSHPARMMICCELRDKELSVGDIENTLKIKQPRLSRELAKLRELGLVTTRRKSKLVYYTLREDSRAKAMVDAICSVMLQDSSNYAASDQRNDKAVPVSTHREYAQFAQVLTTAD